MSEYIYLNHFKLYPSQNPFQKDVVKMNHCERCNKPMFSKGKPVFINVDDIIILKHVCNKCIQDVLDFFNESEDNFFTCTQCNQKFNVKDLRCTGGSVKLCPRCYNAVMKQFAAKPIIMEASHDS